MPVVKLVGCIFALSMEVLVDVILAQLLKAISGEKIARPGSHGVVASRMLHRLVEPANLGVLDPSKKPRDVEVEEGDPMPANARS